MDIAFDAIGLEISDESAFDLLAETVGRRGEASVLPRKTGTLHGRCLKIGPGLEVWMLLYETDGEIVYADCRPAFRARFAQLIFPWSLLDLTGEGDEVVHGFIEHAETEVLFQPQNLTEAGPHLFEQPVLRAGLCGLAYQAEIVRPAPIYWQPFDELALNVIAGENDWCLRGRIIAFEPLRNPQSGRDLFWIYVDLGAFRLEVLVNQRSLRGEPLQVGAFLKAEVWLQGHIWHENIQRPGYEGADLSTPTVDFWKNFKKPN